MAIFKAQEGRTPKPVILRQEKTAANSEKNWNLQAWIVGWSAKNMESLNSKSGDIKGVLMESQPFTTNLRWLGCVCKWDVLYTTAIEIQGNDDKPWYKPW